MLMLMSYAYANALVKTSLDGKTTDRKTSLCYVIMAMLPRRYAATLISRQGYILVFFLAWSCSHCLELVFSTSHQYCISHKYRKALINILSSFPFVAVFQASLGHV